MATVWIDVDACTGAGTCGQIAPHVFHERDDGTWAVKEDSTYFGETMIYDGATAPGHGPEGFGGQARIPEQLLETVIEAAEECPGECVFVEV